MVREIQRFADHSLEESQSSQQLPDPSEPSSLAAPVANPVFYRTYSRRTASGRESWDAVCSRTLEGLIKLGKLTPEEIAIIDKMQRQKKTFPSGRWLWVGGTPWLENSKNFSGGYNCTSTNVIDWRAFGLMMDLAMMGCGTGAILESKYIDRLPVIRNRLKVEIVGAIGNTPAADRLEETQITTEGNKVTIKVGDSRQGWVKSYQTLLELSSSDSFDGEVEVSIDLGNVRPAGESLSGFGGVANPVKLPDLYARCAGILNKAVGRKLNSVECCLLIDEAAVVVVAGNVRRSAGMRQFAADDALGSNAKDNLWQQDENGNWRIDPERDALRMANHTRVFHHKPNLQESIDAVQKQYYSGEGAIQWAGEAVARANIDLLSTPELKADFIKHYAQGKGAEWLRSLRAAPEGQSHHPTIDDKEIEHRLGRYGLNPCLTADTWIHTENGARQIKDLIGKQLSLYVNGELFSTTTEGFFYTGTQPVFKVRTKEGYFLRLTGNHQLLKVTAQTQKSQYTAWVAAEKLEIGDRILLHNHRGLQAWYGEGTFEEGWLLGNLIGDGCLSEYSPSYAYQAKLRYWGENKEVVKEYALTAAGSLPNAKLARGHYHQQNKYYEVSSAAVFQLAARYGIAKVSKTVTSQIEEASCTFYQGFLRGIFDADGSVQGTQNKGISVRLSQSDLPILEAVQRMLLRLGIASTIYQYRRPAGGDSQRELKEYWCQAQHELVIANDNLPVFAELIGFQDPSKAERLQQLLLGYKRKLNRDRFTATVASITPDGIEPVYDCTVPSVNRFDANGIVAHNCGEIIGADFHCNLAEIHLNQIDSANTKEQEEAFTAGALAVATLLNHQFQEERYQYSRRLDPIVGVSFTGLFDFFVTAFGVDWLKWWEAGRPDTPEGREFKQKEQEYLTRWREIVHRVVWDYCDRHNIKRPNRCTTLQPAGTKSLLTGASPGWHPPKAQRFIRRITFAKNDPVALACLEYGYGVVPAQSDKDENGNLLDDPFDPRCTEWLVEIPVEVPWANLPGASDIDISKFSALAQMDFYLQVQRHWTTHNTSATVELTGDEVQALGERIHQAIQNDEGYISVALLARFEDHQSFPRLPFEPISKETYETLVEQVRSRRQTDDFYTALLKYDNNLQMEAGPAGCDSDKCMFPDLGASK